MYLTQNKNYEILGLLFFILFLSSCEKDLNYTNKKYEEKIVFYGILNTEEDINLIVDKTYPSLGNTIFDSNSVKPNVKIFENGTVLMHKPTINGNNFRFPNLKPKSTSKYSFEIKNEKEILKTQEIEFMSKPQINFVSKFKPIVPPNGESDGFSIQLGLKITEAVNPWYVVRIQGLYKSEILGLYVFHPFKSNEIGDLCGQLVDYGNYWYNSNCKNDSILTINIAFGINSYSVKKQENVKADSIIINVQHVSESYKNLISDFLPEGIERVFGNYSKSYSNLSNGVGAIGTINQVSLKLALPPK